jgi:hypothetical protein
MDWMQIRTGNLTLQSTGVAIRSETEINLAGGNSLIMVVMLQRELI